MKLNIGCGDKIKKGYVNLDIRKISGVDIVHDLNTALPYGNDSIDEIIAHDLLEHFSFRETHRIFKDWVRCLKIGGTIDLVVPNIEEEIQYYNDGGNIHELSRRIYGNQNYEWNYHKRCFDSEAVLELFEQFGITLKSIDLDKRAIHAIGVKE